MTDGITSNDINYASTIGTQNAVIKELVFHFQKKKKKKYVAV